MISPLLVVGLLSTALGARSDASIEQHTIRPACDAPVAVVGHVPGHLDRVMQLRC